MKRLLRGLVGMLAISPLSTVHFRTPAIFVLSTDSKGFTVVRSESNCTLLNLFVDVRDVTARDIKGILGSAEVIQDTTSDWLQ